MQKSKFFERIGKLTFSLILTWILVTGIVIAAGTWDTLKDGDLVTESIWSNMVWQINWKINLSDIPTCWASQSLTFNGSTFECNSPVIESDKVQAWTVYHSQWSSNTASTSDVKNIVFDTPFLVAPKVYVSIAWFYISNSSRSETFSLNISPSSIDKNWFRLSLPWSNPSHHNMRISSATWIAVPQEWWSWWASSSVANWSTCYTGVVNTSSKSWICVLWSNHTYYGWSQDCYINMWWGGWWEPNIVEWTEYSNKYTQTCN
jgi:hypothetical protein